MDVSFADKLSAGSKNADNLKTSSSAASYSSSSSYSVIDHSVSQHRRSKSASDKNLDSAKAAPSQSVHPSEQQVNEGGGNPAVHNAKPIRQDSRDPAVGSGTDHRASLESDIEVLQMRLLHERTMRNMLERAMGRASSTLSPGHRHFTAQTRELISEIELLEQEVANREKHVLSLYRSIFDQCVSKTSSERNSRAASPAHDKNEARKHPSIISSSFCSSKKFPLQHLQVMASMKENGKRSSTQTCKTRYNSLFSNKMDVDKEGHFRDCGKGQAGLLTGKTLLGSRTLKDHLYRCPCELSEELVRCMASIYHCLQGSASKKPKRKGCPSLTRSSTDVIIPKYMVEEEQHWSCKPVIEISWLSTDRNHFSHGSCAISSYRSLVEQLERVDVSQMEGTAKVAFWINVYNSLVMHAHLAYGIPRSSVRRMALFHKAAYNIGGCIVSANSIEHFILCFRTPRIGRWFEPILSTALRMKSGEAQVVRTKFGVSEAHPIVCFALCTGARSDPMLRVYSAKNVNEELEVAMKDFLQANVVVNKSRKVLLPKVLERYAKEASLNSQHILDWVSKNVEKKLHDAVTKCMNSKSRGKTAQTIEWLPYSARFRYMFSVDLIDKA
ncbi:hypothetical protein EJ110_NYTH05025 [Nymphaea thermarum]|nr:hypothetical protein EJ110_NYTH05025 [Nymphaea thermarum]